MKQVLKIGSLKTNWYILFDIPSSDQETKYISDEWFWEG